MIVGPKNEVRNDNKNIWRGTVTKKGSVQTNLGQIKRKVVKLFFDREYFLFGLSFMTSRIAVNFGCIVVYCDCGALGIDFVVQILYYVSFADPSLVLPVLVRFICATDGIMRSASSNAFVQVLRVHDTKFEVIRMVLDSLRYTIKGWLHVTLGYVESITQVVFNLQKTYD